MSDNQSTLRIEREQDGISFFVLAAEAQLKRKKGTWQISLLGELGGRPLIVPPRVRMREYCSDKGEFLFSQQVKGAMFGARELAFFIPYKLLDWIEEGRSLFLLVERLDEGGAVLWQCNDELLVNAKGNVTRYTPESYRVYLESFGRPEEKYAYVQKFLETPGATNAGPAIEMLTGLAKLEEDGKAEFTLYSLFADPLRPAADEEKAKTWLMQSAEKGFPEARRIFGLSESAKQIEESPLGDCKTLAERGNVAAQLQLYSHFTKSGEEYNPKEALRWLVKAAESGNDEAVETLEDCYRNSYLVDAGPESFLSVCKKAAEEGSGLACCALFDAYHSGVCLGRPMKKDKKKAVRYLKQASEQGDHRACYRMWVMFEDGNDLLVEDQEVVRLLAVAAESGSADALCDLGELYVTGRIVPKDGEQGLSMLRKAAQGGSNLAQMRIYKMTLEGRYHDILLDIDSKGAKRLLFEYAQVENNPLAQTELWRLYQDGNPMRLTRPEAVAFLVSAAKQNHLPAMFLLANLDVDGVVKEVDTGRAKQMLDRAAKRGFGEAQLALYSLYYNGSYGALSCPINKERAYKWITLSAKTNMNAQYRMWEMYCAGNEMSLEERDAYEILFSAVRAGCGDALFAAAELFATGKGVIADVDKAMAYLTQAAEAGHARSMYRLYEIYTSGQLASYTVQKNERLGYRQLLLSAEQGFVAACEEIVRLFESGNRVGVDHVFAGECRGRLPRMLSAPGESGPDAQGAALAMAVSAH